MKIVGCDYHPSRQQIAMVDTETGTMTEKKLLHAGGEAERFYESLPGPVLVGVETSGNMLWFERLLQRLGHQMWIGDAAQIRACAPRKQKNDKRDARLLLQLLMENRFPRIWVPSLEERDLRQLLQHRHTLVGMRTRAKNQLQHIALNQGLQKKGKLCTKTGRLMLEKLELETWSGRRRDDLKKMVEELDRQVAELDRCVAKEAEKREEAQLLMSHPGVGPILALATVLTLGDVRRFPRGKYVASYLGLIPREDSSKERRRLGKLTSSACWVPR